MAFLMALPWILRPIIRPLDHKIAPCIAPAIPLSGFPKICAIRPFLIRLIIKKQKRNCHMPPGIQRRRTFVASCLAVSAQLSSWLAVSAQLSSWLAVSGQPLPSRNICISLSITMTLDWNNERKQAYQSAVGFYMQDILLGLGCLSQYDGVYNVRCNVDKYASPSASLCILSSLYGTSCIQSFSSFPCNPRTNNYWHVQLLLASLFCTLDTQALSHFHSPQLLRPQALSQFHHPQLLWHPKNTCNEW